MGRPTFSVTELNNAIKGLIDAVPELSDLCVRGELSNYKVYPSGHHYFTMKDAESSLRCVMFRTSAGKLRFKPENGMRVTAFGRIAVYPRDGAYQLYCDGMLPEGVGDLQVAFEQLKQKLSQEGLFDPAHKKPLPRFPRRIAIITSSAGAAVHDMIRILHHRWPLSQVLLLPVRVQGVEAPAEIVGAIRYANEFQVADVIITGRGGGSIEDLWAFNDERVARAIYASEIPVVSAVGHEPDVTISDYVADRRASTPSNAAEIVVPDCKEYYEILSGYTIRAGQSLRKGLQQKREKLDALASLRVIKDPLSSFEQRRIRVDHLQDRLAASMDSLVGEKKRSLVKLAAKMDAMSPLKVLSRGYALVSDEEEQLVRNVGQLHPGTHIRLRFYDGCAQCQVEKITQERKKTGEEKWRVKN